MTTRTSISSRWVEHQTSSDVVCSRVVAREFATTKCDDVAVAASTGVTARLVDLKAVENAHQTCVADVLVAFLHAPPPEEVHLDPPLDWKQMHGFGLVWRLKKQWWA